VQFSETGKQPHQNVETIKREYQRLDSKWLRTEYQLHIWVVLLTTVFELAMFFILHGLDMIGIPAQRYLIKYLLVPFTANLLILLGSFFAMRSSSRSERAKIYTISLNISLCAFVIYTVHIAFSALYLIFAVPMILSVIYADRRLTLLVSSSCIAEKLAADLLINWDPARVSVWENKLTTVNFVLSLLILVIFSAICLVMLVIERKKINFSIELEQQREEVDRQAHTDALTGIGNRQSLREALSQVEQNAGQAYALAMLDLDHFKALNDHYGHPCGDRYLTTLGTVLREVCGTTAQPFRFGGDEFCILFPMPADSEAVRSACREIQDRFSREQPALPDGSRGITLSIGVAEYRSGEQLSRMVERADAALYQAKAKRDEVCIRAKEV